MQIASILRHSSISLVYIRTRFGKRFAARKRFAEDMHRVHGSTGHAESNLLSMVTYPSDGVHLEEARLSGCQLVIHLVWKRVFTIKEGNRQSHMTRVSRLSLYSYPSSPNLQWFFIMFHLLSIYVSLISPLDPPSTAVDHHGNVRHRGNFKPPL